MNVIISLLQTDTTQFSCSISTKHVLFLWVCRTLSWFIECRCIKRTRAIQDWSPTLGVRHECRLIKTVEVLSIFPWPFLIPNVAISYYVDQAQTESSPSTARTNYWFSSVVSRVLYVNLWCTISRHVQSALSGANITKFYKLFFFWSY